MNSLSTRLFTAFLLIILLVILVVGLGLAVLLRNSPVVEQESLAGLNTAARAAPRQNPPPQNQSTDQAASYVKQLADTFDVRVLLIAANGQLIADSQATEVSTLNLNLLKARPNPGVPGSKTGRARDANLSPWLYVTRPAGPNHLLVFAEQQPRFPILVFFSTHLLRPLIEAGALAAFLAALLSIMISRSVALPLQKMAGVAQGIAHGDYSQTAPNTGLNEVQALAQSLNEMSQQVQATQQVQRDFLANVSHELKTPLTSIQGFAQAILDGTVASSEALKRSATIIYDEADRMRRLVEGLLDLARLDAGLRAIHRVPLDVHLMLAAIAEKFGPRAQTKGVQLQTDLPPALPTLIGDADRLAQVFTNLLDNALKHTSAGGSVTLSASAVAEGVMITVKDSGPGIPAEDISRIFERFYQVDKSRAHAEGLGLGLAITKEIVEAHGGSVSVESQVGHGAKFRVRLPLARPDDTTMAKKKK
jgi:two-component system, OmpR family, sensor kinase